MSSLRDLPLSIAFLCAVPAFAQSDPSVEATTDEPGRPKWEAGLVAGGGYISDYPGADESHARALVAPVFIYRGPVLRVDQSGIRGQLFESPDWELNLSATAAFSARDNDSRRDMPGLDYLFGVGPQLVYKGLRHRLGGPSLHLKTRVVMSTDFHDVDQRGMTFDPELRWRIRPVAASSPTLTLWVQPTWATKGLHRYFYQVQPAEATATRPAYQARAGYLGTEAGVNLSRRLNASLSWFATVRAMSLHGAANADSPLLRDKSNFSAGAGLVWTPWRSTTSVAD